ncbi:MAG: GAF domain-containing protein [Deltaproteobacteria bacterium]|nr:GAF domain-containing protein [Deltaproteobacteria bacterium]
MDTLTTLAERVAELEGALARERERVHALEDIGAALGSTLDPSELLTLVLERVSRVMDAERSTLYLLNDAGDELRAEVAQGEDVQEIRLPVGEGLAGTVAKSGRSLNIKDAYKDPRFDGAWDKRTGFRTRSTLCVPLKNQHGRTIGVVQVLNKRSGYFSQEDEALLSALGAQAAVFIENSKLFHSVLTKNMALVQAQEDLEAKVRELDVLFEIAQVAAGATELDELLEGVLARTMRAVGAEAASILLTDDETGELRFRAAVGGEPEAVRRVRIALGQGICGWVAQHGVPQVVNQVDQDERHSVRLAESIGYNPNSVLCVPLTLPHGAGAMELLNKAHGVQDFTRDDLKLATVIAGHVSTAITDSRLREHQARRERLSSIGQFLSSVLHDLKTPLTVISGYARLLADEQEPEKRGAYSEIVLRQVHLMTAMTRETLAFARGERKLWVRKVYLYKFFEELSEQLERDFEGRGITVDLQLNDRGTARFDEEKLRRAIVNLARNAAEALGEGGGTFSMEVDRDAAGGLVLRFSDDGPGVPESIRDRLFEAFTTAGKAHGTGLGLAIVRSIVEEHGGEIQLDVSGGRTTFVLRIPQTEEADGDQESGRSAA